MAEIFISYKSDRRNAAKHLAGVLTRHGYSVWYDYGLIKGDDFDLQLDRQLRDAKAVVVLWCSMSVESAWVSREATLAAKLKTLLPVVIEKCELKLAHQTADYVDLSDWDGSPRSYKLDPLIREVARLVGRAPQADWAELSKYDEDWRMFGAPSLAAFALGRPVERAAAVTEDSLMSIAAREWPGARDGRDIETLQSFELHFPGTYFADQARALRRALERAQKIEAHLSDELSKFAREKKSDSPEAPFASDAHEFHTPTGIDIGHPSAELRDEGAKPASIETNDDSNGHRSDIRTDPNNGGLRAVAAALEADYRAELMSRSQSGGNFAARQPPVARAGSRSATDALAIGDPLSIVMTPGWRTLTACLAVMLFSAPFGGPAALAFMIAENSATGFSPVLLSVLAALAQTGAAWFGYRTLRPQSTPKDRIFLVASFIIGSIAAVPASYIVKFLAAPLFGHADIMGFYASYELSVPFGLFGCLLSCWRQDRFSLRRPLFIFGGLIFLIVIRYFAYIFLSSHAAYQFLGSQSWKYIVPAPLLLAGLLLFDPKQHFSPRLYCYAGVAGLILAGFVSVATDTLPVYSYMPLGFMQGIFTIPLLTAWIAVRAAMSVPHTSMAKETAVSKAIL